MKLLIALPKWIDHRDFRSKIRPRVSCNEKDMVRCHTTHKKELKEAKVFFLKSLREVLNLMKMTPSVLSFIEWSKVAHVAKNYY